MTSYEATPIRLLDAGDDPPDPSSANVPAAPAGHARGVPAAEPSRVLGVPGIVRFVGTCRLCRLALTNPDLVNRVHQLRVVGGHGAKLIRSLVVDQFEHLRTPPPDPKSIERHLTRHIDDDAVRAALSTIDGGTHRERQPEPREALVADYEELRELLRLCQARLAMVDSSAAAANGREFVGLVGEARQLVTRLNAIRASDAMVARILNETATRVLVNASTALGREIHAIRTEVEAGVPATEIAEQLRILVIEDWPATCERTVKEILQEVHLEFGLHW